jgi:UDP-glucuronate decarboxylase
VTHRTLVTGGAGFLGSHLCARLLQQGNQVICLDDFSTGCRENVQSLAKNPKFSVVEHDIVTPYAADVDRIFHLACPASPVHYQRDPIRTAQINFLGALNVLTLAKDTGARVLLASTSEVYGDPEICPQPESYRGAVNCTGPRACYDEGKRLAETLFFDFMRKHGVAARVARIFNTYGPRMRADDGRVVSNFVTQALTNRPLTVYGTGAQTRSFCYVDDMVDALTRLMETESCPGPVNLGNPVEITVVDLAHKILGLCQSTAQITYMPLPVDDPTRRCPDISLARQQLSWEPVTPLEVGLAKTIADFRSCAVGGGRETCSASGILSPTGPQTEGLQLARSARLPPKRRADRARQGRGPR